MKQQARRVLIAFGVLIASLVSIAVTSELALELRAKLSAGPSAKADARDAAGSPSPYRVLMIGDSVLGFLDRDPRGLAGRLAKVAPTDISISEISEPALLTRALVEKATSVAALHRPQLVVLMVGKSDYDASLTEPPRGLQKLRTVRFLRFVWGDVNLRYKRWTTSGELRASRKSRLDGAWEAYAKLDCRLAIQMFSELLRERHDSPTDEPNSRAIYDCYLREKAYDDGAKFFSELAAVAKDGSTFRMYAGSLRVKGAGDDLIARKAAHQEIEHATVSGDPRSSFKTKLWLAKTDGDTKRFATLLRQMQVAESAVLDRRTIENIRTVIRTFIEGESHVIVMQYPTDHLDVWKTNFVDFGSSVSFIGLRDWLLALPEKEMADAVDEDIEHLTNAGADRLAPLLLKEIESRAQNRK